MVIVDYSEQIKARKVGDNRRGCLDWGARFRSRDIEDHPGVRLAVQQKAMQWCVLISDHKKRNYHPCIHYTLC